VQGDFWFGCSAARVQAKFGKSHVVESGISFFNASRKTFLRLCDPCPLRESPWYVDDQSAAAAAAASLVDGLWCKPRQGCGCSNSVVHEIAAAGAQASAAWNWLTVSTVEGERVRGFWSGHGNGLAGAANVSMGTVSSHVKRSSRGSYSRLETRSLWAGRLWQLVRPCWYKHSKLRP
jgi:hypothetical protein